MLPVPRPQQLLVVNGNKRVVAYFGDTSLDNDDDGLSDLYEQSLGSDPFNSDSDGDGLKDGDEANIYGSSPVLGDTDADGFDDKAEVNASTDPKNADDFPFLHQGFVRYFMFKGKAMDNSPNKTHGTPIRVPREIMTDMEPRTMPSNSTERRQSSNPWIEGRDGIFG